MRLRVIAMMDILLIPSSFLFLLSTCVKIASYTPWWSQIILNQQNALLLLLFAVCVSCIFTLPLRREIQKLRFRKFARPRFLHLK